MKKNIQRIILISLSLNVILTIIKLTAGYLGSSFSLVSDGYNSLTDILLSIVLLVFLSISHKEADDNHPYGHEKFEALVYFLLGIILILSSFFIIYSSTLSLIRYLSDTSLFHKPSNYTLFVAFIAIIIKVILFLMNFKASKKYDSPSLKADSMNHLFDILSTTLSFVAIILAQFNLAYMEFIASILIALIMLKTSIEITKEAIGFLVDQSPDQNVVESIKESATNVEGVLNVDVIKARMHMKKLYVDMEIAVDSELSLKKAHAISESVHDLIEHKYNVIHCMVHVNPKKY